MMPMVWYVPPLSPMMNHLANEADMATDAYLTAVDSMRIPMEYLASILSAGDIGPVRRSLLRLTAMRAAMREKNVGASGSPLASSQLLKEADLSLAEVEAMARLLAVAKYDERYVIPTGNRNRDANLEYEQGACSLEELAPPEGVVKPERLIQLTDRAK